MRCWNYKTSNAFLWKAAISFLNSCKFDFDYMFKRFSSLVSFNNNQPRRPQSLVIISFSFKAAAACSSRQFQKCFLLGYLFLFNLHDQNADQREREVLRISCPFWLDGKLWFQRRMEDDITRSLFLSLVITLHLLCNNSHINDSGTSRFSHVETNQFCSLLKWTCTLEAGFKLAC